MTFSSSPLCPQKLRVEITYASYDDHSRCYFYGIKVHRHLVKGSVVQESAVKRRRFREFLELHSALQSLELHYLPSKYFGTSPATRTPHLERYLNHLITLDLQKHAKLSKDLEHFLGLDNDQAFPPVPMTLEEYVAMTYPTSIDDEKQTLAKNISLVICSGFLAYLFTLRVITSNASIARLAGFSLAACAVMVIMFRDNQERGRRKKNFYLFEQKRSSRVKIEHKKCDDLSISPAEALNLPILRERLLDFVSGTTPEYDAQFLQQHGVTCAGLLSGQAPDLASSEQRMLVWNENVLVDHHLVPFLRYNGNNVDKAESQARFAMTTRVALKMDNFQFRPAEKIFKFGASPILSSLAENVNGQRKERLERWWLRDRDGGLCMFARLGHLPSGLLFDLAFNRDADVMNQTMIFFVEMFRGDMDQVHVASKGAIPAQCTVIVDMEGFDLQSQLATGDVLNIVKKYVPLMSPCYSGMLKRYIVINAPWYVNMLLSIVRPFIPKDILDSVKIFGGYDKKTMVDPFVEDKYVPKYLGGAMVGENGDPFCRDRIAPFGPFEADKGMSLLK